ncbi:acyl-CoA dehydrogenase family protein [Paeniroseomonas aquatica]|uniref:acyl-CoA dehydrogenase family protein n=1 Tax=Paeniroseomonas aquatica TaxID=373043 RepID=UPI0036220E0C
MDFAPTEEQRLLRESAAAFVRRHCPREAVRRWDREGEFPETLHAAMVEAGFPAMVVPAAHGGLGSPMQDCAIVYEELARPSMDIASRIALIAWGRRSSATSRPRRCGARCCRGWRAGRPSSPSA